MWDQNWTQNRADSFKLQASLLETKTSAENKKLRFYKRRFQLKIRSFELTNQVFNVKFKDSFGERNTYTHTHRRILLAFKHHTADSGFCNFSRLPQLIIAKPKMRTRETEQHVKIHSLFLKKEKCVNIEKTDSGFCSYRSPLPLTFPKYRKAFERHLTVAPPEPSKIHENAYTRTHTHTHTHTHSYTLRSRLVCYANLYKMAWKI